MTIRLKYNTIEEAKNELLQYFAEWNGEPIFSSDYGTLVIVNEIPKLDENGDILPSTWVGTHIDIQANVYNDELEANKIPEPSTPSHNFL